MSKRALGSEHYKMGKIEPIEYIEANGLARGFYAGNIIKYVTRYPYTDEPIEDLEKARHYLDLLLELEKEAYERQTPKLAESENAE